jgi:hypothetical protein
MIAGNFLSLPLTLAWVWFDPGTGLAPQKRHQNHTFTRTSSKSHLHSHDFWQIVKIATSLTRVLTNRQNHTFTRTILDKYRRPARLSFAHRWPRVCAVRIKCSTRRPPNRTITHQHENRLPTLDAERSREALFLQRLALMLQKCRTQSAETTLESFCLEQRFNGSLTRSSKHALKMKS